MKHFFPILSILFFYGLTSFARVEVTPSTNENTGPDPNFHIYICFGQSNMEGPAAILPQDTIGINPRFKVMTVFSEDLAKLGREVGNWYTAKPPLCKWYTGLGPYDYFGRTLTDSLADSIKVGVIVVAMGGSGIDAFDKQNYVQYYQNADAWQKSLMDSYGGCPYNKIIEMAKLAQQSGVIKGILLHQGETNNGQWDWLQKVQKIYNDMVTDLSLTADNVPLLSGEMLSQAAGGNCWGHNNIMANLPYYVANSYVISSAGCSGVDDFHFSTEGMRELGKRYGLQMWELLKTYNTVEGQTVDHLVIDQPTITMLTGSTLKIPIKAVFADGHQIDIRNKASYQISNPNVVKITNGYIETLIDGMTTVLASYKGTLGEAKQVSSTVISTTFPLTEEQFNADIWGDGTFTESTSTLRTGQWGFGGWQYTGLNLSDYKYIVAKLGSTNTADVEFKVYDENNYWASSTSSKFGSKQQVVVNLKNINKSDGVQLNPAHVYIMGFWSNGSNSFVIDTVFLSNSSDYDPAALTVNDVSGNSITKLQEFKYLKDLGPSSCQTFMVSGVNLTADISVQASSKFEIALDSTSTFSSKVTLTKNERIVPDTKVFVRMKSGLSPNTYSGNITISSSGVQKLITLTGSIQDPTGISEPNSLIPKVVTTEYYSSMGQKLTDIDNMTGIFIQKQLMSDGTVKTSKILKIKK